jgi:phage terminase large subunit-like protein
MSSWEKYVKKYVWDRDKTPYHISVENLTRTQADNEIFVYVFFLATASAIVAFLSLAQFNAHGAVLLLLAAIYAFSILCGAICLGVIKHLYASLYCGTAPLVVLLHHMINGFHPNLHEMDHYIMLALTLLWLRYAVRVVAIAKNYPDLRVKPPAV